MMKYFRVMLVLLPTLIISQSLLAQKSLESLLVERDTLYKKQKFLETKNTSFWGTKSKKDLRKMIENLEDILRKDNEIITAIKRESFASHSNIVYETRDTREENSKLASEVNRYKNLNKQKLKELKAAMEDLENAKSRKTNYEIIILVLVITLIGLLYYNRRLYRKLN